MGFLSRLQSFFQAKELDISKRFELLREAITGTMSQFYVARDIDSGKVVGLKLLDREKTQQFEARFKGLKKPSEGEIASSIKHPLIVDTFEYGVTNAGQPYLVMEFVKGVNLHMLLLNRDPMIEGQRAKIVQQMAEAIEAVHKAGYIHRDICPRNFIYNPDTQSVKMIDFGLTVPATKEFMQPGNRTGTPQYMSPEVVRRRPTDQRLDIFSFGVSAYHVCSYELPWPSSEATGKVALSHDTHPPVPILNVVPKLNRKLAEIIMKCVEPQPDRRPADMTTVVRALRRVESDNEPTTASSGG